MSAEDAKLYWAGGGGYGGMLPGKCLKICYDFVHARVFFQAQISSF